MQQIERLDNNEFTREEVPDRYHIDHFDSIIMQPRRERKEVFDHISELGQEIADTMDSLATHSDLLRDMPQLVQQQISEPDKYLDSRKYFLSLVQKRARDWSVLGETEKKQIKTAIDGIRKDIRNPQPVEGSGTTAETRITPAVTDTGLESGATNKSNNETGGLDVKVPKADQTLTPKPSQPNTDNQKTMSKTIILGAVPAPDNPVATINVDLPTSGQTGAQGRDEAPSKGGVWSRILGRFRGGNSGEGAAPATQPGPDTPRPEGAPRPVGTERLPVDRKSRRDQTQPRPINPGMLPTQVTAGGTISLDEQPRRVDDGEDDGAGLMTVIDNFFMDRQIATQQAAQASNGGPLQSNSLNPALDQLKPDSGTEGQMEVDVKVTEAQLNQAKKLHDLTEFVAINYVSILPAFREKWKAFSRKVESDQQITPYDFVEIEQSVDVSELSELLVKYKHIRALHLLGCLKETYNFPNNEPQTSGETPMIEPVEHVNLAELARQATEAYDPKTDPERAKEKLVFGIGSLYDASKQQNISEELDAVSKNNSIPDKVDALLEKVMKNDPVTREDFDTVFNAIEASFESPRARVLGGNETYDPLLVAGFNLTPTQRYLFSR